MDIKKIGLYLVLAVIGIALWNAWQKDYPPASVTTVKQQSANSMDKQQSGYVPSTFNPDRPTSALEGDHSQSNITNDHVLNSQSIQVTTDTLKVAISSVGANLIRAQLPKYPVSLQEKNTPVQILTPDPARIYVAQVGLTNTNLSEVKFSSDKQAYQMEEGQNTLVVSLTGKTKNGLDVVKTYTFTRGKYAIDVKVDVKNNSGTTWRGSTYFQVTRRDVPPERSLHVRSYDGPAISSPEHPYEKITYSDLDKSSVDRNIKGGWIAMQQQYFLSAWVPPSDLIAHYYSSVVTSSTDIDQKTYTLGYVFPQITLDPGASISERSAFYVGPELAEQLDAVAKGLSLTVDYGWLWFLSEAIFWVMQHIYNLIGNWGWSIVLVTILIKLLFYPLSDKSYRSMAKLREIQPRLQALKERYGDDRQALSKATMEFYKKEKINPMGGCLPMLVQIPVFFALYFVLIEAVQLRQAPFIFWIQDLSVKDPYYVLPILMGLSMFLQQKLSPPPPDPTQAKVMMLLPVIFTVFFLSFPAGLVLYWLTNNLASILQQWYVMKTYHLKQIKTKKKKKK